MKPSMGACFLIVVAATLSHLTLWPIGLVVAGYVALERLDQWLARRDAKRTIEQAVRLELELWEPDPANPEWETCQGLTRRRFADRDHQMLVTRLAELLRNMGHM